MDRNRTQRHPHGPRTGWPVVCFLLTPLLIPAVSKLTWLRRSPEADTHEHVVAGVRADGDAEAPGDEQQREV